MTERQVLQQNYAIGRCASHVILSPRLAGTGTPIGAPRQLTKLDTDLEFALAEADDTLHRHIAAWAALRCFDASGMIAMQEFGPAVAALGRNEPVPPPFNDAGDCWTLYGQTNPPHTTVPNPLDRGSTVLAQNWALPTLFLSAHEDSLVAVMEVTVCLAHVHGHGEYRQAFADLRARFLQL